MKFVVLGPTGGTGRRVVEQAVAAGHQVVAYARRPHAVTARAGVTVVGGAVDDIDALTGAMADADAVILCLGPGMSPRAFLSVDVLQRAVPAVITAMRRAGVGHLLVMSALGVADTARLVALPSRLATRTLLRAAFDDKERIEPMLAASGLLVTTIYPVTLTNGPATGSLTVRPVDEATGASVTATVSREDVAAVLVDLASHPGTSSQRLYVG